MISKTLIGPILVALFISSLYLAINPSSISDDAAEYDKLADSITHGEYSIDGAPSMLREPGYPAFRAMLKTLELSNEQIRLVQLLLYCLTILFIGMVCLKIDPRLGIFGAWGASLSYGLALYPSLHLSESLTAFLLSIFGLVLIKSMETLDTRNWAALGVVSGALLLTRYSLLLIPITCALTLVTISIKKLVPIRIIFKNTLIFFFLTTTIVSPWVIRNYTKFGVPNVAGRFGSILYARAWKAERPWHSIPDSYLSVFVGRGLLFSFYPSNQSIFQEQWHGWQEKESALKLSNPSRSEIDQRGKEDAFKIIFKDINNFAKFSLWAGVDLLRTVALPNPVLEAKGSPIEGTYGPLAKESTLSPLQMMALIIAHKVQLIWFVCIIASLTIGFKKYRLRFIPGLLFISFILPHSIIDSTARFSMPLQPWILSGIFMTVIYLGFNIVRRIFVDRAARS